MYYRRKFLLGFIEAFGGTLKSTYLEKLLFLYMKKYDSKIYSFYPYQYGCFSIISYQDKEILIKQDFLENEKDFKLKPDISFFSILKENDKINIRKLHRKYSNISYNDLVRETYIDYPKYAVKSVIKDTVLSETDFNLINAATNLDKEPVIFSIGYEGITIDEYLFRLISYNIKLVIDVRKNPQSMKYNFNKKRLSSYLKNVNIQYLHLPELGIPSELRRDLKTKEDYINLFTQYREQILAQKINELEIIMSEFNTKTRIALTCFEADANYCHRKQITNKIKHNFKEISIKHI